MKKTISKLLALALTASLVLSGCGGSGSSDYHKGCSDFLFHNHTSI